MFANPLQPNLPDFWAFIANQLQIPQWALPPPLLPPGTSSSLVLSSGTVVSGGSLDLDLVAGNGVEINSGTISADNQGTITLSGTTTGTVNPAGLQSCLVNVGTAAGTISVTPGYTGQHLRLEIKQGATPELVAFDTTVVFGLDITSFTATPTAGARDLVQLICLNGTHWGFVAVNHGFAI